MQIFRAFYVNTQSQEMHNCTIILITTTQLRLKRQLLNYTEEIQDLGSMLWIRIRMFLGLLDPHPNTLDRGTDPRIRIRIRIRTKMSQIHSIA